MNNKWINEGGVFYPIPGNVVLHVTPGPGVYEIVLEKLDALNKLFNDETEYIIDGENLYVRTEEV